MCTSRKIILAISIAFGRCCAEKVEEVFEIIGYVKADLMGDTRQGVLERQGHSYLFPLPCIAPCNGDINNHGQWNVYSIESNFGFKIKGPKVLHAIDNYAMIVGDFWGTNEVTINNFRLKYGYLNLEWERRSFVYGQLEQALFIPECSPGVLAYNNGAPLETDIYVPQFRYIERFYNYQLLFAGSSRVMDPSPGPLGFSMIYIRNSLMPNFTVDFRAKWPHIIAGAAVDIKRLVPRIVNDFGCKVHESVVSASAMLYATFLYHKWQFSNKLLYAENLAEFALLGGYAVKSKTSQDIRTYTPLRALIWWTDIARTKGWVQPGLFMGYTKNLGARHRLYIDPATEEPVTYTIASNVDYVLKIMPRLRLVCSQITFATELEYSQARYGVLTDSASVMPTQKAVHNARLDFTAYYYF